MMSVLACVEGTVIGVAAKYVEKGVTAVVKKCRYMCCLKQFEEDMDNEEASVSALKDDLDRVVERERRNTRLPNRIVENWINSTATATNDVRVLKTAIKKKKDERCFKNNWCPNCFWQYSESKKADKLIGILQGLRRQHDELPQELAYEADRPNIEAIQSDGFMSSNTSKLALQNIFTALENGANMIGLHGMPGVGKTTLAKQVIKEAQERKLFDEYFMITVSKTPDINHVRNRLADILGVVFEETSSIETNAGRLMARLQDDKTKLLVLDNLWGELNLTIIGIPPIGDLRNCKVLLTTRSEPVCNAMNCQSNILLNTLSEEEGWDLFKYTANPKDGALMDLAKQVAKECGGLPLAIMSVGKALRRKTGRNAWERALEKLKEGEIEDIQGISRDKNPYRSIKFSFDELSEKAKGCLLLCALFRGDYGIFVDQLVKYAERLELYHHSMSSEEVLSEIMEKVEELIDSHLLLGLGIIEERKGIFKMHDLIRDVVLKIGRSHYLVVGDHSRTTVEEYFTNNPFTNIQNETIEANNLRSNLINLSENGKRWMLLCTLYVADKDEEICVMELGGYAHIMGMYESFEDTMGHLLGAIDEFKLNHFLLFPTRDRHIRLHPACSF